MNDLHFIKTAAFNDELEKLGYGVAAKLLTQALPKLLRMGNTSKVLTGPGVRRSAVRYLERAGARGDGFRKTIGRGIEGAAQKFGGPMRDFSRIDLNRQMKQVGGNTPPKHRAMLSRPGHMKAPIAREIKGRQYASFFGEGSNKVQWFKDQPSKMVGEAANNLNLIRTKGTGRFLKHNLKKAMTYEKDGFRYKRSPIGQVGGLAFSGPGFGASSFALGGTNAAGQKQGLGKRTGGAVGEAALWSIAPHAAGIAMLPELATMAGGAAKSLITR